MSSDDTKSAVAQTGRRLGPRAMLTRERLLDAAESLLRERSIMDISVVEIARLAETSAATFYHYFRDVEGAVLVLAEQAAEELPATLAALKDDWSEAQGLDHARDLVEAFIDHWDRHHAVLLVRNLSADKGDQRFQKARRNALAPVLDALALSIDQAQKAGRVSEAIHPKLAAAALLAVLERLSAHFRDLKTFKASREDLLETCARIIYQTITGQAAA